jgi:transcription elongation factor Elf1
LKMENKAPRLEKASYASDIYDFIKEVYVICPGCGEKALVKANHVNDSERSGYNATLTCLNCGYNKNYQTREIRTGAEIDPYFYHPLWFSTICSGNILWAYNLAHLDFLERHVSAQLRERNTTIISNNNLGSRLPRWMTSAKNHQIF